GTSGRLRMTSAELNRSKERLAGIFLLALTLLRFVGAPHLVWSLRNGYQDFTVFYHGAEMVRTGQAAQLHDLHPPFEELLFVPLTYLSYLPAYVVWTFLNVVMMILSLVILRKTFAETERLSPLFLILSVTAFAPAVRALIQGQDSILLLLLVTVSLFLLGSGRAVWAGAALGCGLFKFHLMLPLALVLVLRRPRLLLGLGPVAAMLVAIWAMMTGWHGMVDYGRAVVYVENHGAGGTPIAEMPNLRGLIAQLAGKGGGSGGSFVTVAAIVCAAVVLGIVLWKVGRRATGTRFVIAAAIVTCILVGYHAVIHDLTLLLPVVLMLFAAPGAATRSEMRVDAALLVAVYAILFMGSWIWPWLSPWWCFPMVAWICRKYGRGDEALPAAAT
ncbi:MAG TPA: glycosyltransferase family 87 protein, partial [Terriglobales bacterium]|nr:glycosyltransferase family 87 protein [Terriglobales bacterium]